MYNRVLLCIDVGELKEYIPQAAPDGEISDDWILRRMRDLSYKAEAAGDLRHAVRLTLRIVAKLRD